MVSRQEGTEAIDRVKSMFDASWARLNKPERIRRIIPATPAIPTSLQEMISSLPTDIADIIFKKHAELRVQYCDDLVQKWKNAMTKFMINGRLKDKHDADDIQHELKNTDSAIAFTLKTSSTMMVSANTSASELRILKNLTYTIKTVTHTYETEHSVLLPVTQLTDTTSQFEVIIESETDDQRASMVKTAGELINLMEYKKPTMYYRYQSKYIKLLKKDDAKISTI